MAVSAQHRPTAKRVIVVEDNHADRVLLRRVWDEVDQNVAVDMVDDGQSAWERLKGAATARTPLPDLVLLDLNLPGLDGRQLLELVRADPLLRSQVVVVLTTSVRPEDVERVYELGASSYIAKPSSFVELRNIVRSLRDYWLRTVILPSMAARR